MPNPRNINTHQTRQASSATVERKSKKSDNPTKKRIARTRDVAADTVKAGERYRTMLRRTHARLHQDFVDVVRDAAKLSVDEDEWKRFVASPVWSKFTGGKPQEINRPYAVHYLARLYFGSERGDSQAGSDWACLADHLSAANIGHSEILAVLKNGGGLKGVLTKARAGEALEQYISSASPTSAAEQSRQPASMTGQTGDKPHRQSPTLVKWECDPVSYEAGTKLKSHAEAEVIVNGVAVMQIRRGRNVLTFTEIQLHH